MPTRANRLAGSTSPYLLQHARNPVDWYPWGEEALTRAQREDKPILLSIGYSACHWCHVMAHESFEDEAIAALMNEHFVNVKVDREERPDLDDIYMAATLAMNHGQGGWPMTVFLTPAQQPFFAGTYFPPEDRHGRPGFPAILRRIAELWSGNRAALERVGAELTTHLREATEPAPGAVDLDAALTRVTDQLAADLRPRVGRLRARAQVSARHAAPAPPAGAPPWRRPRAPDGSPHTRRHGARRDVRPAGRRLLSLLDRRGAGWCRTSRRCSTTTRCSRAPTSRPIRSPGDPFYRQVATEVLEYVLRDMTAPEGGFYSATDADSEGVEGKFFVWTPAEVRAALGDEAAPLACAWFDISEDGNWEGHSIPRTPRALSEVAGEFGLDADAASARLAAARRLLHAARNTRVQPGLDDKVLTAWNGLMIGALAEGARVLGEARWLEAAARAADFVLAHLRRSDGRLLRTWRAGTAHLDAYLEDYAFLGNGLLDLYEAGGAPHYFEEARRIAERILTDFAAPGGGFFSTSAQHETLLVRHREGHDGAVPAANAAAAHLLARLAAHEGRSDGRAAASDALGAWGAVIAREPRAFAQSLMALAFLDEGPVELAFIGRPDDPALGALRREVQRHFLPHRIVAHHDPSNAPSPHPLLAGKGLVGGRSALYVCRDFTCREPVTLPEAVPAALGAPGG